MLNKNKICFIVSEVSSVKSFLENHIKQLSVFFDVFVVGNFSEKDILYLQTLPINGYKVVRIVRKIFLLQDFKSLIQLYLYFRKENFFAIHSVTPKAGLITAIAGKLVNTKNRIHIFTGQVWASRNGARRHFLKLIDKYVAKVCTHILVDGYSQRDFLITEKVVKKNKPMVLANGSIAGVNTEIFCPNLIYREEIRKSLRINNNQIVFIFLGRLCKDKGVDELLEAFSRIQQENNDVFLLLVGPDEGDYANSIKLKYNNFSDHVNFHLYGRTTSPEKLLNAGDVFCMPSYREGFGVSVIEASSTGLAVIISDVYGLKDSVLPKITGLVSKVKDVDSLYLQMQLIINNHDLRKQLGINGREFVVKKFNQKNVSKAWLNFYNSLS